ncbi:MAG: 3-hydroxybutyrate dehydrogenase [Pseudomonadota bacterium]
MAANISFDFSGKRVLVTGSNSGIGLEAARAFARAGANVALNSLSNTEADHQLAHDLAEETGQVCIYLPADLSQRDQANDLVARCRRDLGGVDILVNNAGIQHVSPVEEFSDDAWDRVTEINLSSQFATIRAALPAMRKQNWGRIINVASAHGLHASANKSAYIAAKHGVVGLSKTTALEVAETGITCNAVCPGYVFTPIIEGQIPDQMAQTGLSRDAVIRDVLLTKQPTKRFIEMEEIASAILYISSDMARSITGHAFAVDGGWGAI